MEDQKLQPTDLEIMEQWYYEIIWDKECPEFEDIEPEILEEMRSTFGFQSYRLHVRIKHFIKSIKNKLKKLWD